MSDDTDEEFEKQVHGMLAKAGEFVIPSLTPERLAMLRTLIPDSMSGAPASRPSLSLIWQRIAEEAKDALVIVKAVGATVGSASTPLLRDGSGESRIETVSCPLLGGEMTVQLVPLGDRKAKLVLSVKGGYGEQDGMTVELTQGDRLIEARPLEQKAEVTIQGVGAFLVTLYLWNTVVGEIFLNIGEAKDSDNG